MTSKYISVNVLSRLDIRAELALGIQQIGAPLLLEGVPATTILTQRPAFWMRTQSLGWEGSV